SSGFAGARAYGVRRRRIAAIAVIARHRRDRKSRSVSFRFLVSLTDPSHSGTDQKRIAKIARTAKIAEIEKQEHSAAVSEESPTAPVGLPALLNQSLVDIWIGSWYLVVG